MSLSFRLGQTVTGKAELIAAGECEWQEFPQRAQAIVDHFGMVVTDKIDGLDERIWIACVREAHFCIAWDIWFPEVSLVAWKGTPEAELQRLATDA
jgi:hypothetical protein